MLGQSYRGKYRDAERFLTSMFLAPRITSGAPAELSGQGDFETAGHFAATYRANERLATVRAADLWITTCTLTGRLAPA